MVKRVRRIRDMSVNINAGRIMHAKLSIYFRVELENEEGI